MYGTVMIGRFTGDTGAIKAAMTAWEERGRSVPGYLEAHILLADDGETIVNTAMFASREHYQALADDPAQDAFYQAHLAPLLQDEPRWIDGEWVV